MSDETEYFWSLSGDGHGDSVRYADSPEQLADEDAGDYYSAEIYTQCFLPKWVYRGADFTMISADTNVDGNKFLMIFDNEKMI